MFGSVAYAQAPFASAGGNTFQVSVSESAAAMASFSAFATFSVLFSGAGTAADETYSTHLILTNINEAAALTATPSSIYQINAAFSDAAAISHPSSPSAAATFLAALQTHTTSYDALSSVPTYATNISDTTTASDATSSTPTYSANTSDTGTASDETAASFAFPSFINESTTATATLASNAVFPASVSAAATLTESAPDAHPNFAVSVSAAAISSAFTAVGVNFTSQIAESSAATVSFIGQPLWEQINDDQVPVWTDILQPQIISDVDVFGGSNFGVLAYTAALTQNYNPNPVVWNPIDDTQEAEWTDIVAV